MTGTPGSRDAARLIKSGLSDPPAGSYAPEARPYLEAFFGLAALLPETQLPPRLATERMRAVSDLAERTAETGPEPDPAGTTRTTRTAERRRTVTVPAVALGALLLALAFVTALLFLPRPEFSPQDALYLFGTGAASGARGVVLDGGEAVVVFASGLEELERGYRYVAWTVNEEGYERMGSMVALGSGRLRLRTSRSGTVSEFEITIESSTATGQPAGPTVLAGFRDTR